MPYKDPAHQRQYQREYRARRRSAARSKRRKVHPEDIPPAIRMRCVGDVLALLETEVGAVKADADVTTESRARLVGYLCGLAMRAVETGNLEDRIQALEATLKARGPR